MLRKPLDACLRAFSFVWHSGVGMGEKWPKQAEI